MVNVTAVRTTGIYCHSGCSARPNPENTDMYGSQVAAEVDGFRPCLRCRPDLQPGSELDATSPAPLRRALELVGEGMLDSATETELAAAVGYSQRHLRRLFVDHLGATPDAVARSRRAHFARRLLDETDLAVTQIAFAAGFNSVRQMNRVVRQVFAFAPRDLRRRRRRSPDSIDGGLALTLPAPNVDWKSCLRYLAPRSIPGVEVVEQALYARTFTLCGHLGVIEIAQTEPESLDVLVHLPDFAGLIDVAHRVRRLVGLDLPSAAEVEALANDAVLGPLVLASPSTRVPGAWDRFESLIRIVVGQQVSVVGASTMAGRLVASCTEPVTGLDRLGLDRRFPTPTELAEADLEACGFTGRRAQTIRDVAGLVASGEIRLDDEPASLAEALLEVRGIGPWTTELVSMRVSRSADAFPSSDLGLRDGVGALVGGGRADASDVARVSATWAPNRSLAAALVWSVRSGSEPEPKKTG
ncbi:MAG: DNA-3-methyladenine glycosylase 2 family protein [Actinobacteria bacterium]|nr:DNA-3-methyladenine glycosylase 2 family protein [Actinomycetota bacterium]